MAVRLVVTITAAPGKGSELAQAFKARCTECMQEPGCEQFEVFQSVLNPDKLALLELWKDQAALDVHAKVNETRQRCRRGCAQGRARARTMNTTEPARPFSGRLEKLRFRGLMGFAALYPSYFDRQNRPATRRMG